MRMKAMGLSALLLAGCASVPAGSPAGSGAQAGPFYGPGSYAAYNNRTGTRVQFDGHADERVPTNYGVYDYKDWHNAGTFGRVTAWNKTGRVLCVQVVWGLRIQNGLMGSKEMVLPPNAANHVIGFWTTTSNITTIPGYSLREWPAPVPAAPNVAVTDYDCRLASPYL